MTARRDTWSNVPLSETTFFILLSLTAGPKHGYAIMKEVMILTDRRVVLSTGTLYGALKRLLRDGWIERAEDQTGPEGSYHARKAYTLTNLGRRILEAEVRRLRALLEVARVLRPAEEPAR